MDPDGNLIPVPILPVTWGPSPLTAAYEGWCAGEIITDLTMRSFGLPARLFQGESTQED